MPVYFVAADRFRSSLTMSDFVIPVLHLGSLFDQSIGVLIGLLFSSRPTSQADFHVSVICFVGGPCKVPRHDPVKDNPPSQKTL